MAPRPLLAAQRVQFEGVKVSLNQAFFGTALTQCVAELGLGTAVVRAKVGDALVFLPYFGDDETLPVAG